MLGTQNATWSVVALNPLLKTLNPIINVIHGFAVIIDAETDVDKLLFTTCPLQTSET